MGKEISNQTENNKKKINPDKIEKGLKVAGVAIVAAETLLKIFTKKD